MDIPLSEGDLGLIETPLGPDLAVESEGSFLLKRALTTPWGHIAILANHTNSLKAEDQLYGNRIYRELSEPQDLRWLEQGRAITESAIQQAQLQATVLDVKITFPKPYFAQVAIRYQTADGSDTGTLNLPVSLASISSDF